MLPDSSREQALQYVKEFLKKGGYDTKIVEPDVKSESVTETF